MDIHLCEYEGKAFYIEKGRVVEIFIKSRVVVNAAYFREENPNYTRPSIKESNRGPPPLLSSWTFINLDESDKEGPSPAKGNGMDPLEVKGDNLLIYSLTVPGFSLGNNDLYIPAKKKKAVRALSEAYIKRASTNAFNDIIKGKGQGFNAVLLLDEADILLEQRLAQDIHRNTLVYVFLQTLEYYQGMIFLTTNRVGQIDNAIASRIHFKLKYATPQGEPIYSRDAFDNWIRKEHNGREECQVNMSHLEMAIGICEDFECDFKGAGPKEAMNGYF
ncbi:uncharacterized protein K444DRAFT_640176 [Hyaloscypha bicolor E]|uniref:ATPase AAA-type core domain-containing protein n=1 Tax=Hyaloscypha bicolor E TaxID=1095630 RepID=A0A2J6TTF7_9HELO|nr:uncharacterized protein K444DRAFT_640176 [Hyaloscypha bicolor E]PMD66309.1 hypothetical protein K444DRAFT_640176 [Hyaloscypha bicolor E]